VNATAIGMAHTERPLHWAASNNDVALIDALLDLSAALEASGSSIDGGPPLSSTVGYAQWQAARRLVERGARAQLWNAAPVGMLALVSNWSSRRIRHRMLRARDRQRWLTSWLAVGPHPLIAPCLGQMRSPRMLPGPVVTMISRGSTKPPDDSAMHIHILVSLSFERCLWFNRQTNWLAPSKQTEWWLGSFSSRKWR
jgi:hypothetical protein